MPDDIEKIPNQSGLLRRIHRNHVVTDKISGVWRLSSAAFKDPHMSVDAENLLAADGLGWQFSLAQYPDFGLVRLRAGLVRQYGQTVEHKEVPGNKYHAEVVGRKPGSVADALRQAAEWVKKNPGLS